MSQSQGVDHMLNFYSNLSEKRTKVLIAKTKNDELTRRLGDAQKELFAARDEYIKTHITAEQAQQMLSASHVKATTLKETKRRKHEMVELIKQLSKEDYLPQQKRSFRESQSMAKSFTKETSTAPWLPEKKELLNSLDKEVMELDNIRNELKSVDEKIRERKDTIDLHQRYPFRNFCIDMITYRRKSANIKQLLAREIHLNAEMKSKLPMCDESQDFVQMQIQSQAKRGDDLEKSVLENEQEEIDEMTSPMVVADSPSKDVDEDGDADILFPDDSFTEEIKSKLPESEESQEYVQSPVQSQTQKIDDLQTQIGDDLEKSVLENEQEKENDDAAAVMVVADSPVKGGKVASANVGFPVDSFMGEADGTQNNFLNFSTHSQAGNTSQGAPGDFMSMLNMVNESENVSGAAAPGGGFFDLFGGGGHDKSAAGGDADNGGKESQESVGGMFNFNFGNASVDDGPVDGGSKKSFFDF